MAIPSQEAFYRPVLEIVSETGAPLPRAQLIEEVARQLSVSEPDRQAVYEGKHHVKIFNCRVDEAVWMLANAGLIERPRRGEYQITPSGLSFLPKNPEPIRWNTLTRLKHELESQQDDIDTIPEDLDAESDQTIEDIAPQELINHAIRRLNDGLESDLQASINGMSDKQFELLGITLLEQMGYGEGEHTGGRGDAGIDGVVRSDPLGLGPICCMQAKRWRDSVGDDVVRTFSGSLDGFGATRGVIIATSRFTKPARDQAKTLSAGSKVIRLIDGPELVQLMIAHKVGVITEFTLEIKKVDENYFADV